MRRFAVIVFALLLGCSSKTTSTSSPDGGEAPSITQADGGGDPSPADADAGADSGVDGGGEVDLEGCLVRRASKADDCAEACDARLKLPGGGSFCTVACEKASDCAGGSAAPSNLTCPPEIGACVPTCTADGSCKAAGFLRCDVAAGGCDTI